MYEIGRLCVKIAGRDARMKCVVIDILEGNFVLIDGQTRRKRCNVLHLEPLDKVFKIKKNASHSEIVEVLKKEGIEVQEVKSKQRMEKPSKAKPAKEEPKAEPKPKKETKPAAKKTAKKAEPKAKETKE